MDPPIFMVCAADDAVKAALGDNPVRLFPFGDAPQDAVLPYAVWQVITGAPENFLANRPDADSYTLQVDVYADGGASAISAAKALRDAIEPHAYIARWGGRQIEYGTNLKRVSFDVDWIVQR